MRIAAAVLVLMTALPAHAASQSLPRIPPGDTRMPGIVNVHVRTDAPEVRREIGAARTRIEQGEEAGQLSKREARALRREARQIGRLTERYSRDGLSDAEQRELDMRARALQSFTDARRFQGAPATR